MSIRIVAEDPNSEARNRRRRAAMEQSMLWESPEKRRQEVRKQQAEQRRRHKAEQRAMQENAQLTKKLREVVRRVDASAQEARKAMAEAEQRAQQEIAKNEVRTRRAIAENNIRMQKELAECNARAREETAAVEKRLRSDMEKGMKKMQQELEQVDQRVRGMELQHQLLLDKAEEYETAAEAALTDVKKHYDCEKLVPGGLKKTEAICRRANEQLELADRIPANSAAALSDARNSFTAVLEFRENVQLAEELWMQHEKAAAAAMDAVEAHMEASRTIQIDAGNGQSAEVKVQYYSNGDLSRLSERFDHLLESFEQVTSVEELDMVKEAAQQLEHDLVETCAFAAEAFLLSQDRADAAEDISRKLDSMGLTVLDYSYQDDDYRAPFRLLLENLLTGFCMAVTQTPKADENGGISNVLETEILKYGSNSAEEGCEMAQAIASVIAGGAENMRIEEDTGVRIPNVSPTENMKAFQTSTVVIPKPKHTDSESRRRTAYS